MRREVAVTILILAFAIPIYADEVKIASGKEPVIDGKIDEEEWKDAVKTGSEDLTVYFKHGEKHLFVGLECSSKGISNIFIQKEKDDTVYVLHSSAALGEARYKYDKDKKQWKLEKQFLFAKFHAKVGEFRKKGKSLEEAAGLAQEEFEKENGWCANYVRVMGPQGPAEKQFEFQIAYSKLGIDLAKIKPKDPKTLPALRIVAGIAGRGLIIWPEDLKDGASNDRIHCGFDIQEETFSPETWAKITSKDNWLKPKDEFCEKPNKCHDIHIEAIGTCSSCGKEIPNKCDKYCVACAKKSGVCRLCGKKIK